MTDAAALAVLALKQVAALLDKLSSEQLGDLAEGRGQLEFHSADVVVAAGRPARRAAAPRSKPAVDVAAAVTAINSCSTGTQVEEYLVAHEKELTAEALRAVARALGPTVTATGRSKADLRRNIVAGTAGFRERSEAMSSGAWR